MYLKQAILHILDKNTGNCFLSQKVADISQPLLRTYLDKLLQKVQKSDVKQGQLAENSVLYQQWRTGQQEFIRWSQDVAQAIYDVIAPAEEIAAADYLFFEASDDADHVTLGFVRLDYSSLFTHFLAVEDEVVNQIVPHHAILPSMTQRPSEAMLLNMNTRQYQLLEKQYVIEGKRTLYLSEMVLAIEAEKTAPQQLKQIKRVVAEVAKQFDEPAYLVLADTQKIILDQLESDHAINAEKVTQQVFKDNLGAQAAVRETFIKREVPDIIEVPNIPKYEKKYSKQKFKLANGIEIVVPVELYNQPDVIEFINHPDGSISVMIKNAEAIVNGFNG